MLSFVFKGLITILVSSSAQAQLNCSDIFSNNTAENVFSQTHPRSIIYSHGLEVSYVLGDYIAALRTPGVHIRKDISLTGPEVEMLRSARAGLTDFSVLKLGGVQELTILIRRQKREALAISIITPNTRLDFKNLFLELYSRLKAADPLFELTVVESLPSFPIPKVELQVNGTPANMFTIALTGADKVHYVTRVLMALDGVEL